MWMPTDLTSPSFTLKPTKFPNYCHSVWYPQSDCSLCWESRLAAQHPQNQTESYLCVIETLPWNLHFNDCSVLFCSQSSLGIHVPEQPSASILLHMTCLSPPPESVHGWSLNSGTQLRFLLEQRLETWKKPRGLANVTECLTHRPFFK